MFDVVGITGFLFDCSTHHVLIRAHYAVVFSAILNRASRALLNRFLSSLYKLVIRDADTDFFAGELLQCSRVPFLKSARLVKTRLTFLRAAFVAYHVARLFFLTYAATPQQISGAERVVSIFRFTTLDSATDKQRLSWHLCVLASGRGTLRTLPAFNVPSLFLQSANLARDFHPSPFVVC